MKKKLLFIFGLLFFIEANAQTLTNRQIYDFNIGDVIESDYYYSSNLYVEKHQSDSVMSKFVTVHNDTFYYGVMSKVLCYCGSTSNISYQTQYVNQVYFNLDSIPKIQSRPDSTFSTLDTVYAHYKWCNDSVWYIKYEHFSKFNSSLYYTGLGGPFNSAGWDEGLETSDISFFKKQNISCGSRFNFEKALGINFTNDLDTKCFIFPNPTSSSFTISKNTNENLQLHLYNLIGQNVWNENLKNETTQIERNGLPASAYLFSITNLKGKIVQTGKIIFE